MKAIKNGGGFNNKEGGDPMSSGIVVMNASVRTAMSKTGLVS